MKDFLKRNFKSIIVYSTLVLTLIVLVVVSFVQYKKNNVENTAIVLSSDQLIEKINNKESFNFVIGANRCGSCKKFNRTIKKYTKEGNTLYYIYIDNNNDLKIDDARTLINNKILNIPPDRQILANMTPTTIVVRNGEFVDGILGYVDSNNSESYKFFKDTLNGDYIGKNI